MFTTKLQAIKDMREFVHKHFGVWPNLNETKVFVEHCITCASDEGPSVRLTSEDRATVTRLAKGTGEERQSVLLLLGRLLVFVLCVACAHAATVTLTPASGQRWMVAVTNGQPGQFISRAAIDAQSPVPFRFKDDAKASLEQGQRDSWLARETSVGEVAAPTCATAGAIVGQYVTNVPAKAFAYGSSLGCVLWGVLHKRKSADVSSQQARTNTAIQHLVPDEGVTLDRNGTYIGLLFADVPGGQRVSFEVK